MKDIFVEKTESHTPREFDKTLIWCLVIIGLMALGFYLAAEALPPTGMERIWSK